VIGLDRIDHVVFTVPDVGATCAWYSRVLGTEVLVFGDGRKALHVGHCKINLHQTGREFEPKAARPAPGTQDICLVTTSSMREVVDHLTGIGEPIIAGPVAKTGAMGPIESVYLRDPDGNLVELAWYADRETTLVL